MLKRSRWLLLKRPEKLTGEQRGRLAELVRRNLRTVRAYLLKEDFQSLWGYVSPYWAGQFLDRWCTRTMRSRLDPMKEVARMVALAPRPDSELVPSPGAVLQWRCRRLQRKGQSDHQTGVWVPHLRGTGSRFVSRTWRPARTKTHPQILLTRPQVMLTAIERRRLETWASARSTTVRLVERSKIVLMACAGMPNQAIAKALGIDQNTVGRWRNRFVKERVKGIEKERPRGGNHGGKDSKRQAKLRARIIEATTQTTPKDATHWSTRTMARAMGTTHSVVHRVWQSTAVPLRAGARISSHFRYMGSMGSMV